MVSRDDVSPTLGVSFDDSSPYRLRDAIERSGVAICGWGSWLDGGTALAALGRFQSFRNPQRAAIGPWSHGAGDDASPYQPEGAPVVPSAIEQWLEARSILDSYLEDGAAPPANERVLSYRSMRTSR